MVSLVEFDCSARERKMVLHVEVPRRRCENANDGEERLVLELHRAGVVTEEQLYRLEVVWRVVLRGGAAMAAMAAQGRPALDGEGTRDGEGRLGR